MDEIGFGAAKTAKKEKSETAAVEKACPEKRDDGGCFDGCSASDLWWTLGLIALTCVGVGFVAFFTGISVGRQRLVDEINASNLSITFSTQHCGDSIKSWVEVNPSVD